MNLVKAVLLVGLTVIASAVYSQSVLRMADSLKDEGNYSGALPLYNQALTGNEKLTALDSGNLFMRRGICYVELNMPDKAIADYFASIYIFERLQNKERIAAAAMNISDIYFLQKDYESAGKYLYRALDLLIIVKDSVKAAHVLNDLAGLYKEKGDYAKALSIHTEALHEYGGIMGDPLLEKHLFNKGNCFENINQDSCLFYYKQAETVARHIDDSAMLSVIYNSIGDVYKVQGNYAEAVKYFNESYLLGETYGSKEDMAVICHNLAEIHASLHQYDSAYYYSKKETALNEELYNIEKSKFSIELSEKYESGKKDEKILSQETENKLKSRNLLLSLIGLGLAAALAVISFISYKRKQKANLALQQQNERIEKLNKQLDESNQVKSKLFSVISHDIRGPVSSIYAYLQMQKPAANHKSNEAFSRQTDQLLETLEDLLVWSKSQLHQFVPVSEIVFLQPAISQAVALLQHSAEEKALLIVNEVPQDLTLSTDMNMLAILLRNALSNAVKYALPGSTIEIRSVKQKTVDLFISNHADAATIASIPYSNDAMVNSTTSGLGFTLMKEFAAKLGGNISYAVSENIVTAIVSLPAT